MLYQNNTGEPGVARANNPQLACNGRKQQLPLRRVPSSPYLEGILEPEKPRRTRLKRRTLLFSLPAPWKLPLLGTGPRKTFLPVNGKVPHCCGAKGVPKRADRANVAGYCGKKQEIQDRAPQARLAIAGSKPAAGPGGCWYGTRQEFWRSRATESRIVESLGDFHSLTPPRCRSRGTNRCPP